MIRTADRFGGSSDLRLLLGLEALDERSDEAVRRLAKLPDEEWRQAIRTCPDVHRAELLVERLNERSHDVLDSEPARAADLAFVATRVAAALLVPDVESARAMLLEADAWRHYAAAKADMHECHAALEAARVAHTFYDLLPMHLMIEPAARLRLTKAFAKCALGDTVGALNEAEVSANLFRDICENDALYVKAKLFRAWILAQDGQYEAALQLYEECTPFVHQSDDAKTMISILGNVAWCVRNLGEADRAQACYGEALAIAERQGFTRSVPAIRSELALMLIDRCRYNEAISELYMTRSQFLALEMNVDAILATLYILDALLLAGRTKDVANLYDVLIPPLVKPSLHSEIIRALAHLAEEASIDTITRREIERVRLFITSVARGDADAVFFASAG